MRRAKTSQRCRSRWLMKSKVISLRWSRTNRRERKSTRSYSNLKSWSNNTTRLSSHCRMRTKRKRDYLRIARLNWKNTNSILSSLKTLLLTGSLGRRVQETLIGSECDSWTSKWRTENLKRESFKLTNRLRRWLPWKRKRFRTWKLIFLRRINRPLSYNIKLK